MSPPRPPSQPPDSVADVAPGVRLANPASPDVDPIGSYNRETRLTTLPPPCQTSLLNGESP
jgi:hypothetical protein